MLRSSMLGLSRRCGTVIGTEPCPEDTAAKRLAVMQGELDVYACKVDGLERAVADLEFLVSSKDAQIEALKRIIQETDSTTLQQECAKVTEECNQLRERVQEAEAKYTWAVRSSTVFQQGCLKETSSGDSTASIHAARSTPSTCAAGSSPRSDRGPGTPNALDADSIRLIAHHRGPVGATYASSRLGQQLSSRYDASETASDTGSDVCNLSDLEGYTVSTNSLAMCQPSAAVLDAGCAKGVASSSASDVDSSAADQAFGADRRRVTCNNPLFCDASEASPRRGLQSSNCARKSMEEAGSHNIHQQCNLAKAELEIHLQQLQLQLSQATATIDRAAKHADGVNNSLRGSSRCTSALLQLLKQLMAEASKAHPSTQAMQGQLAGAVEELSLLAQRHRHMAQSLDPLAKTLRSHLAHLEQLEA